MDRLFPSCSNPSHGSMAPMGRPRFDLLTFIVELELKRRIRMLLAACWPDHEVSRQCAEAIAEALRARLEIEPRVIEQGPGFSC